ncbi:hypothetical protein DFJ74DRAFT_519691 [Hyaloraphidium curvatum]|nr:hypothetical protein DFJ74DRAFT_519691 [Hyaloraphidium curvatum]
MSWGSGWGSTGAGLHDAPSHYNALRDVPVVLNEKYRVAGRVDSPKEFRPINEDLLEACDYDFVFERKLLEAIERDRLAEEELRQKSEAARLAKEQSRPGSGQSGGDGAGPGSVSREPPPNTRSNGSLTDVDFGMLDSVATQFDASPTVGRPPSSQDAPIPNGARPTSSTPTLDPRKLDRPSASSSGARTGSGLEGSLPSPSPTATNQTVQRPPDFNFLEFEQGLAPPDPWDVPQDDLSAIGEVLGVNHHPRTAVPPSGRSIPPSARNAQAQNPADAGHRTFSSGTGSFQYPTRVEGGHERPFSYLPSGSPNRPSPLSGSALPPRASPPVPPRPASMSQSPSIGRSPDVPEAPSDLSPAQKVTPGSARYADWHLRGLQQALFSSVVAMGFPADAVARAVRHHSTDEKKVVDFAVAFTPLMGSGLYTAQDIEIALLLFDSDYDRADRFLKGSARLREMGFAQSDVQEALLYKNNDEMAAAEWLLAGKKG